ncbi:MAG: aminotransferase class V-fold PLP-dependent enzyme [Eubacteriales bacterium]|nr:aminotransferase class V-fold PLP-dependent enzyme [Eubacteriales bacterium]
MQRETEVYLDNAATSHPKPPGVLEAMTAALTEYNANAGRSGHSRALRAGREVLACRQALGNLLQTEETMSVVFTQNCTDALNLAIKGLCRSGGHVVSTMLEHNSVLRVLDSLRQTQGLEYTLLSPDANGIIEPDAVKKALRPNTQLIAMTHASSVTGAIQPVCEVGAVARETGVPYLVDGAQALGTLPVSTEEIGCSLYAFPGHKAVGGPQGTGGLYIRPGVSLAPLREGGTGTDSDSMRQPAEPPERYESGTLNLPGIAGLRAAAEYAAADADVLARERELTELLLGGLAALGATVYGPQDAASRVGTVSFNMGDLTSSELADMLDRRGICVRGGLHCAPMVHRLQGTLRRGAVRASIGRFTVAEDIDELLRSLYEIEKGL